MGLKSAGGMPDWLRALPRIPLWNLDRTEEQALKLFKAVVKPWRNCELTTASRQEIAEMLLAYYKAPASNKIGLLAAVETLLPYSHKLLTKELARLLCYQFTVNKKRILRGEPVHLFTGVGVAEWMPLEITGFENIQRGPYSMGQMDLLVLDGPYAGFRANRVFPWGYLRVIANDLGYSRRRPYENPVDLIDFRMAARVEPSQSADLLIEKYWVTTSMDIRNRSLVTKRKPSEKELEDADVP